VIIGRPAVEIGPCDRLELRVGNVHWSLQRRRSVPGSMSWSRAP
jgi:hypothetical protein